MKRFLYFAISLFAVWGIGGCGSPQLVIDLPTPTFHPVSTETLITTSSPTPTELAPTASWTSTATASPTETPTQTPTQTNTPEATPAILTGAGDISVCGTRGSELTAELIEQLPGDVFTAGDNTNESGLLTQYTDCFEKTWGRFKDRIHPSPGNHDYMFADAQNYYTYFGAAAGEPGKGYYSYDLGTWHIVVLNSNCNEVACGKSSAQLKWLQDDLDAHPSKCTLAYWHHPRFSSGLAGTFGLITFWNVLYDHGVDVVVNGNDHDYERFAPQDPLGNPDPTRGIREFVVGTGGASQRRFSEIQPNSEVRNTGAFGVIKFSLYPDHYDWEFIPVAGESFSDSGSTSCHD